MGIIDTVHLSRIDLNLFVVLETIHAEGGITRAAEKLHLSQPAISHALARLRDLFGDPLFVRQGQAMVPTPFTRNLMEPVRAALRLLEGALNETQPFDPGHSRRRFVVGMRAELEALILPALLGAIGGTAPNVELAAVRLDRKRIATDLAAGTLDAALDVLLPAQPGIRHQRLGADRLVVVLRRDDPAAKGTLDLETYLRRDHVLVSSRRRGASLEDIALQRMGRQRRVRVRCQQYFAAFQVVAETGFALTLPASQAAVTNRAFGHAVLPLPLEGPALDRYLYWHEGAEADPAQSWLRDAVVAAAAQALGAPA